MNSWFICLHPTLRKHTLFANCLEEFTQIKILYKFKLELCPTLKLSPLSLRFSKIWSYMISNWCDLSSVCVSPAEHQHIAGGGLIGQRNQLLKTQLLTASVKSIRTVGTQRVVIATRSILHRPQAFWTLQMIERRTERSMTLLPGNYTQTMPKTTGSYYVMNKSASQRGKNINEGFQGSGIQFTKSRAASIIHLLHTNQRRPDEPLLGKETC